MGLTMCVFRYTARMYSSGAAQTPQQRKSKDVHDRDDLKVAGALVGRTDKHETAWKLMDQRLQGLNVQK